jgi:hypothetical protein
MDTDAQQDRREADAAWKAEMTQSMRTLVLAVKGPEENPEHGIEHKVDFLMQQWHAGKAIANVARVLGAFGVGCAVVWASMHDAIARFLSGVFK